MVLRLPELSCESFPPYWDHPDHDSVWPSTPSCSLPLSLHWNALLAEICPFSTFDMFKRHLKFCDHLLFLCHFWVILIWKGLTSHANKDLLLREVQQLVGFRMSEGPGEDSKIKNIAFPKPHTVSVAVLLNILSYACCLAACSPADSALAWDPHTIAEHYHCASVSSLMKSMFSLLGLSVLPWTLWYHRLTNRKE